jgi:hypothetical protein
MLFRERVAAYCENHAKRVSETFGENMKFLKGKSDGICGSIY